MKSIFLLLFLGFSNAWGQSPSNNDDITILTSLNARFIHNFVTNDTLSHGKIIHKDFVAIGTKGRRTNRKDYLRN